jgi:hypothetical protein
MLTEINIARREINLLGIIISAMSDPVGTIAYFKTFTRPYGNVLLAMSPIAVSGCASGLRTGAMWR